MDNNWLDLQKDDFGVYKPGVFIVTSEPKNISGVCQNETEVSHCTNVRPSLANGQVDHLRNGADSQTDLRTRLASAVVSPTEDCAGQRDSQAVVPSAADLLDSKLWQAWYDRWL